MKFKICFKYSSSDFSGNSWNNKCNFEPSSKCFLQNLKTFNSEGVLGSNLTNNLDIKFIKKNQKKDN